MPPTTATNRRPRPITISLDEAARDTAQRLAAERGIPLSYLIEALIAAEAERVTAPPKARRAAR